MRAQDADGSYELIAGERRLRAAAESGFDRVPCIVINADSAQAAVYSVIENLQRRDLNFFEEALAIESLGEKFGLDRAQISEKLGKAPSTVSNKLRLLRLPEEVREKIIAAELTERHARALLRLPENRRSEALITIAKRKMNARATDLYIEQLLNAAAPGRHRISMVKDVRIFVNTIDHAIRLMTDNGVPATAHREERDGYIEYTVRIPTAAAQR